MRRVIPVETRVLLDRVFLSQVLSFRGIVLCACVICPAGSVLSIAFVQVVTFFMCPFLQVDPRMLKAVAIEHNNDPDSAVVAVLDEIMPSMVGSVGVPSVGHEAAVSEDDVARNLLSSNQSVRETGSSSSAGKYKYRDLLITV